MRLLKIEKHGHIALLTIDRADALNALGREGDGDAVRNACAAINADADIRCAILTGEGKAFSAGGDVKAMKTRSGAFAADAVAIREGYRRNIHQVVRALFGLEVPLIAAVNGAAIGLGCDVACMADIRIASDKAIFGATFLKLGVVPGEGGVAVAARDRHGPGERIALYRPGDRRAHRRKLGIGEPRRAAWRPDGAGWHWPRKSPSSPPRAASEQESAASGAVRQL